MNASFEGDSGDARHLLVVGLLALAPAHDTLGTVGFDHRDALAVDRADEDLPVGRSDRGGGTPGVEALEVDGGFLDELLG
jgi:hypothetical protein